MKALERRLSTIFSHMSRSTYTGSGRAAISISSRRPAFSSAERNRLARSRVYAPRSTGSYVACTRPASMRENSSRLLTSRCSRSPLRRTVSHRARSSSGSPGSETASSAGAAIRVSGVRNSWEMLLKNAVFARSSSASASARRRSSSYARALARLAAIWPATRLTNPEYEASSGRYGLIPATRKPAGRSCPCRAIGTMTAWRGGSLQAPAGTLEKRSASASTTIGLASASTRAAGQAGSGSERRITGGAMGWPARTPEPEARSALSSPSWNRYTSVKGRSARFVSRLRATVASMASSPVVAARSAARSRSVASLRSPITRSVSSITTLSIPAVRPSSSVSGL